MVERIPLSEEQAQEINYEGDISKATMHMVMNFGGSLVMASDDFMVGSVFPQLIMLDFNIDEESIVLKLKEIAKNFEGNAEYETLTPLEEEFWGGMMGQYKDKFGNTFMLHGHSYAEQRKKVEF